MNNALQVKVLHLLTSPLEVWEQNEAYVRVGVLKDNALCLLLVIQDVVDPLEL